VFAAHEARHGCRAKGGCRRERGTRHFGFVAKAIGHHRRFCVYFCHKLDFTGYLAPAARKYPAPRKYRAGGPDISKKSLLKLAKVSPYENIVQRFHMARSVNCIKLGIPAEGLDFPPYPGELGKRIWESVSKEAWAAWLKHQTMLVNENRLSLADARARQYLARQMENHFFGDGADAAQGYVPPTA
jgi:Fe-S cluster biosynthesis and repair protein YggX